MDTDEEKLARTVDACRRAGIVFRIVDGKLTISFDKLDWSAWPELKLMLEDLDGSNLLGFIESHTEFQKKRRKRSWSLISDVRKPGAVSRANQVGTGIAITRNKGRIT